MQLMGGPEGYTALSAPEYLTFAPYHRRISTGREMRRGSRERCNASGFKLELHPSRWIGSQARSHRKWREVEHLVRPGKQR